MILNDGKHIVAIMNRQACKKHPGGGIGLPCFHIPKAMEKGYFPAICNRRAVLAGANGNVTESSFQTKKRKTK